MLRYLDAGGKRVRRQTRGLLAHARHAAEPFGAFLSGKKMLQNSQKPRRKIKLRALQSLGRVWRRGVRRERGKRAKLNERNNAA
jgi:hypothetical protein